MRSSSRGKLTSQALPNSGGSLQSLRLEDKPDARSRAPENPLWSEIVSKVRLTAGRFEQKLAVALVALQEHLEPGEPVTSDFAVGRGRVIGDVVGPAGDFALMPQLAGARREASFRLGR
jgi:hypothetical protein